MAENGTRRATFHTDDPRYDISVTIENVSFSNESADNVDFVINAKFEGSENVKKINTTNLNTKLKIVNLNVEEKRFDISGTGKYEEVDLCLEFHLTNGNKCNYNIPIDIENFGNKNELVIKGARPEFYAIPERRPLKGYKIPKSFLNALRDLIKKYPEFTERMPNLRKLLERGFKIKNDIWKNQPESRLLVTTPSNAAADVIMIRLQNIIPKMYMFRLCGHNYGEASKIIADFGEDITNLKNGRPYMPEMNKLSSKRVIIATLVTATRLVNGKFPCGHFSHVFMDEGGYATETESLLPAVGIMTDESKPGKVCGQFVISGDPRQLGPRIHSNFNKFCGLGTSMLERLIDTCDIYARDETKSVPYDERCITKLLVNYRSHEEILRVPNELFYDGELKPASDNLSQLFVDWEELPKQGFPVIFHNVNGEDKQDKSSPSFFNEAEVKIVTKYVEKLLKDTKVKGMTIKDEQIGVITPYRRQAEKIKNECGKMQYKKVNIGTVQVFQGKENIVTIISTVRSKNAASHEKDDELYDLGLLNSPKRFNVALTRAKSLLIVVGNADVLKVDRYWRKFLQHCIANNAIKGNAIELSDDDILTDNGIFAGEDDGPDFNDGQF